jgi:hypothetical protein
LPAFTAESVVEALEWDFRPYTDAKGVIREPSDGQIAEFLDAMKAMQKEAEATMPQAVDVKNPASLSEAMDALHPEDMVAMMGKMAGIYAELCGRTPTKTQILALPLRVRQQFYMWLQTEVMNPETGPGAGRA